MAHPATNTLVENPSYKGHDPQKWKYIGQWDSKYWLKDKYEVMYNGEMIPQYDLVCGKGIVALDNLDGGGFAMCSEGVKIKINCIRRIYESYYNLEAPVISEGEHEESNGNEATPKEETLLYSEIFEVKKGALFSQKYNICFLISLFTGAFDDLKEYGEFPLRNYKNYVYTDGLYNNIRDYIDNYKNNAFFDELFSIDLSEMCLRLQYVYNWNFDFGMYSNQYLNTSSSFIMDDGIDTQQIFAFGNIYVEKANSGTQIKTTYYDPDKDNVAGVLLSGPLGPPIHCLVEYEQYTQALNFYNDQNYRAEAETNHDGNHYSIIRGWYEDANFYSNETNKPINYVDLIDNPFTPTMTNNYPGTLYEYVYNVEQEDLTDIFIAYGNLAYMVDNDDIFSSLRDYAAIQTVIPIRKILRYKYWNANRLIDVDINQTANILYNTSLSNDIRNKFNELRPTELSQYDIKATKYNRRYVSYDVFGLDDFGLGEPTGKIIHGTDYLSGKLLYKSLPSIYDESGREIKRCVVPNDYKVNDVEDKDYYTAPPIGFCVYYEDDIYDPDPAHGNNTGGFPYIGVHYSYLGQYIEKGYRTLVDTYTAYDGPSEYCVGPPTGTVLKLKNVMNMGANAKVFFPINVIIEQAYPYSVEFMGEESAKRFHHIKYDIRTENVYYFVNPQESTTNEHVNFHWRVDDLVDYNLTRYTQLDFMKELEEFMNNEINIEFTAISDKEINIYFDIIITEQYLPPK